MYAGDCGVPASPTNGTVAYTTTTEGSLATFQCSAGLVPGEVMTAVCEESGGVARWSPNPGDLSCTKPESFPGQGIMIEPHIFVQSVILFAVDNTGCANTGLSTAEAIGIAIALSSIVSFSAGLLVALVIAYCYIQRQKGQYSPSDPRKPALMYEDVSIAVSKDIELKENVAYGPINH